MQYHPTHGQVRRFLQFVTVLFLVYLLVLLITIFLRNNFKRDAASLTKRAVTSVITRLFTSESSSLSYLLDGRDQSPLDQALNHAFFSPVLQYVQAASNPMDGRLMPTPILIHTTKNMTLTKPSPKTASSPLEASHEIDLETNASLDTYDNVYFEDEYDISSAMAPAELSGTEKHLLSLNQSKINSLTSSLSRTYLLEQFYKINPSCVIDDQLWNVKKLLTKDLTITKNTSKPQILILHTHAHEAFADSRPGVRSDSIVGVGDELARILKEKYGYNVLHSTKQYDYNTSYNEALVDLKKYLKEYPSIQIVIDLHRDGVSDSCSTHTVVSVNNEQIAPIMFFNGVCNNKKASLNYHTNPNLQANLAFSLQMKLYAMQTYPQFTKKNFLKSFRYNMHVVERYSLVEVGDNNNTVAEVKAAMSPLADILNHVLTYKSNY